MFYHGLVKKENKISAGLVVTPQSAKVTTTVCDKSLVKMKKALNLCMFIGRSIVYRGFDRICNFCYPLDILQYVPKG
jgi:hypothetical protein